MQSWYHTSNCKIRFKYLVWFCACFSFICFVNSNKLLAQQPHLKIFTLPDSYEDFKISNVLRNGSDFIYAGTNKGLVKFDGSEYFHFDLDSTFIKPVSCIDLNKFGIYVGFDDGDAAVVRNNKLIQLNFRGVKNTHPVNNIIIGENGDLVIGTDGNGLFYFSKDSVIHITKEIGLVDNTINTVLFNKKLELMVGTDRGLYHLKFQDSSIKFMKLINESKGLPDNLITDLLLDNENELWISMHNAGVCSYNMESNLVSTYDIISDWKFGSISSISKIENEVWMATQEGIGVLSTYPEESFQLYDWNENFSMNEISDLYKDDLNNAIFVDNSNNIFFTSKQFIFINKHEGVDFGQATSIFADSKGFLWFSASDTLFQHPVIFNNNNVIRKHLSFLSAKNTEITSIYEDVIGNIWVGTFDEGLFRIDPLTREYVNFTMKHGLIDNSVLSIEGDSNNVWFATLSGLSKINFSNQISSLSKKDGLPNSFIYDLEIDRNGILWMATDGDGIISYNGSEFTEISKQYAGNIKVTYNVIEDSEGTIWFSSPGNGVASIQSDSIVLFNLSSGLSNLDITGIINDGYGNLVICNKRGIDIMNTMSGEVQSFSKEHGLSFANNNINNLCKDANGNIWISAEKFIVKYLHHKNPVETQIPITLNSLNIFLEPTLMVNDTILQHNQNHVTINYSGFWFHDPSKIRYQYKLDGFDLDWQNTSDKFATYSNLPAGKYLFSVRASINNTFNNDSIVSTYSFEIARAFYNTYWFRLLAVFFIALMVYFYIKYRENRLRTRKQLETERVKFQLNALRSQVNPHFLFNSFNTLLSVIDEDSKKAGKFVEQLSDFFRNILSVRDDNAILLSEELELLKAYVFLEKERFGNNLNVDINLSPNILNTYVPPLTLQLIVENCIKHNIVSKAKPLNISITNTDEYITVSNNVQLKITKPKSTGIGLSNIKQRYNIVCDDPVTIYNDGKKFIVNLPLINNPVQ